MEKYQFEGGKIVFEVKMPRILYKRTRGRV